jgi:hypothetical protein
MSELLHARAEDLERFKKLYRVLEDGCWEWRGQVGGEYQAPYFNVAGVTRSARRWIYEVTEGKLPPHRHARRTCQLLLCVNPEHVKVSKEPIRLRGAVQGPRLPLLKDMSPLQRMERRRLLRVRYLAARGVRCADCGGIVWHEHATLCKKCFGYNKSFRKNPYGEDYIRNRYQFFKAKRAWDKKQAKR